MYQTLFAKRPKVVEDNAVRRTVVNMTKPLILNGTAIGGGKEPLICTSLIAKNEAELLSELAIVVQKSPDIIEWRVDFFEEIGDVACVLSAAQKIRESAKGIPIIFTRRSTLEGGETIAINEDQVLEIYQAVCASKCVDFIDSELSRDPIHFKAALNAAHSNGIKLIASFHNFQLTPSKAEIVEKFVLAEKMGADIAKVAVMPRVIDDVLTLLSATIEGNRTIKLPIISMSMGPFGSLSRLFGWALGSSVTFAVCNKASAPGQVPIAELRTVLEIVHRSLMPK